MFILGMHLFGGAIVGKGKVLQISYLVAELEVLWFEGLTELT